ncbi:MAG TPA: glycosyltransferase family 1 protein [bacterium]|nr:glycosyltransferase family 1 protein [bacterium]
MIIGIDASRANRSFKTGTEWYSYYLIINLIEIDLENNYILYTDKPLNQAFLFDLDLSRHTNVKIKYLKWPFKYMWTLGRLTLEMIFNRPDVLFVPAHVLPLFSPKKTINTIHDIAFMENNNLYNENIINNSFSLRNKIINFFIRLFSLGRYNFKSTDYLNWSTKFALRYAKKIITVSNFTKNEILKYYRKIKGKKIKVIYNGYNNYLYKKITDEEALENVLKKYGIDTSFFLYIGRLEKKKNVHCLIESFSIFKENNKDLSKKLVLIGNPGFCYDEIKYLIEELGIYKDVIILGWVEEEDLPYIVNKAEAFIFPSFYEGFGIPILQAMACETPVLLSNIEVFHEIAQDSALFFDHLDPNDLAEKMVMIVNDDNLKMDLINRGKSLVSNFSWRKCAQETLKEINNL